MPDSLCPEETEKYYLALVSNRMCKNGVDAKNPHGISHIEAVLSVFKKFYSHGFRINGVNSELLHISIIFHDIGRGLENEPGFEKFQKNHAFISEYLFNHYDISGANLEEKKMIAYAIKYHNQGLKNRGIEIATEPEEILGQVLIFFDCCDGLRVERIESWARENKMPDWDDETSLEEVERYFASGRKIPEEIKSKSLILNLIFNINLLSEEGEVISPIWDLIDNKEGFVSLLEEYKKPAREKVEAMIREKRENKNN